MLHGANDPRVTVEQADAVFRNLRGEKEFVLFESAGHASYLAANPDQWNRTLSRFLEARSADSPLAR
jgi:pimeloyl-ACP methyl ester carboxylesterase